jgi:ribosomal protein L11 methyltransferase
MYLWRRSASRTWLIDNEDAIRTFAGDQLAVIERPERKRVQLEVASKSRALLQKLETQFGGQIEKLPRDWLKRSLRRKTKPIKVGNQKLIIPAGAAFGTGEHATTAMSLKMLERAMHFWGAPMPRRLAIAPSRSRTFSGQTFRRGAEQDTRWRVRPPELIVDLGTGSGILALAAKLLGAKRAIGIDNDPIAVSSATQNARLNKIRVVQFRVANVRLWKPTSKIDIVTANLFSELLIEILPKLTRARRLILSGILRKQEGDMRRALRCNKIEIFEVRRRGKWVAILAGRK